MDESFVDNLTALKGRESANSFAKHCGLKPQTMLNYLDGTTEPKLSILRQIAAAANVSVGTLVGDPATPTGHSAVGSSGVMQAGNSIANSTISAGVSDLNQAEERLIKKLRRVGSPLMIEKFMKQLQDLEDYLTKDD